MTNEQSGIDCPDFPALLIDDDGSVGVLDDILYWTSDVDQWYWSSAETYLVDSQGLRFDQRAERADDDRPLSVPEWVYSRALTDEELRELTQRYFPEIRGEFRDVVGSIVKIEAS